MADDLVGLWGRAHGEGQQGFPLQLVGRRGTLKQAWDRPTTLQSAGPGEQISEDFQGPWYQKSPSWAPSLQGGPAQADSLGNSQPSMRLQWGRENLLESSSTKPLSPIALALHLPSQPCCGSPVLLGSVASCVTPLRPIPGSTCLSLGSLSPLQMGKVEEVPRMTYSGPHWLTCVPGLISEWVNMSHGHPPAWR